MASAVATGTARVRTSERDCVARADASSRRLATTSTDRACERKDTLSHRPESSAFRVFRVTAAAPARTPERPPMDKDHDTTLSNSEVPTQRVDGRPTERGCSHWVGLPALEPIAGPARDAPALRAHSLLSQPRSERNIQGGRPRTNASSISTEGDTMSLCKPPAPCSGADHTPPGGCGDGAAAAADRGATALRKRRRRTKAEILAQWESGNRRLLWRCAVCLKILHRNMKKKHPCVKRLKVRCADAVMLLDSIREARG